MFGKVASVQYDDLEGSIALDNDDVNSISAWAIAQGLINNDEHVFGFEVNYQKLTKSFTITLNTSTESFDAIKNSQNKAQLISDKQVNLSGYQFIDLITSNFKRINIIASKKGL